MSFLSHIVGVMAMGVTMKVKLLLRWVRYHVLFRFLALFPAVIAYRLAKYVGYFDSRMNADACNAYQQGIAKVFPDLPQKQRHNCWQSHCEMMSREILDIFRLSKITSKNCHRIINIQGIDVLKQAQQGGRGVILAMAHFGRPTMLSTGLGVSGHNIGMVTQIIDERNPGLNSVERGYLAFKMKQTTDASKGRWIMLGDSIRPLYSGLKAGETIIILFDLHENRQKNILEAPFLGGKLTLPRGIERISRKTGAQVIYGAASDAGRKVTVNLRSLSEDPSEVLLSAVAELEKDITNCPSQWWQWGLINHIWTPPVAQRN